MISGEDIPALKVVHNDKYIPFGALIGRKGYWLNSLLFAAFLICLYEPSAILSLSFQLSFIAVLFISISAGDRRSTFRSRVFQDASDYRKAL